MATLSGKIVTYTPNPNANGTDSLVFRAFDGSSYSNNATVSITIKSVNDAPVCTAVPAITGPAQVGQTLNAATGAWNDTADGGGIASYSYQWQRADSPTGAVSDIPGASGSSYAIASADQGKVLRVKVTATDAGTPAPGLSTAAVSAWTAAVAPAVNQLPTITAPASVTTNEDIATAVLAITVGDVETPATALILSATSSNPTLVPASGLVLGGSGANRTLVITPATNQNGSATITVTVKDGANQSTSRTIALTVTPVNDAPVTTALPTIAGVAQVGQVLTAANGNWNDAADGGTIASYAYQWQRADSATAAASDISGATAATYTLAAADLGKVLRVKVTATDTGSPAPGLATAALSAWTTAVIDTAPTITVPASVTTNEDTATAPLAITVGDAETAATALILSATSSNPTLVPASGLVLGGSGANRTLVITPAANQNGSATITVTVKDGANQSVSRTIALTVTPVNNAPVTTALPTIAGVAQVGQVLTAANGTWNDAADGGTIASYAYQWQRADSATAAANDISGATAATYTLAAADLGKVLRVKVTATDAGTPAPAATASAYAAWTAAVTASSPVNAAPVTQPIAVTTVKDQPATVGLSGSDANGDPLTYAIVTQPGMGTVVIKGAKAVYTPAFRTAYTETFTYKANDGKADSKVSTVTVTVLNRNFLDGDVGAVAAAGSSTESGQTVTVKGSGAGIAGVADEFHFAHRTLKGDGLMYAQVGLPSATNAWAKAGLMLRETLDPGSRYVFVALTPANGLVVQHRTVANGPTTTITSAVSGSRLLAIQREGDQLTLWDMSASPSVQVGSVTMPLPAALFIGCAVTATADGQLSTATFTQTAVFQFGTGG